MATFDKETADKIVMGGGWTGPDDHDAPDNPQALVIVEYANAYGGLSYGITFYGQAGRFQYLHETDFVQNPIVYWTAPQITNGEILQAYVDAGRLGTFDWAIPHDWCVQVKDVVGVWPTEFVWSYPAKAIYGEPFPYTRAARMVLEAYEAAAR